MAKGLAIATGIVIAGLLGALLFVSTVPPALMSVLGQGTSSQDTSDFDELVGHMEEVCAEERESATGGLSLFDGAISFENKNSGTKIIFVSNNEKQGEREIDCNLENYDIEITGTTGYTIIKDNGRLEIEKDAIEEMS